MKSTRFATTRAATPFRTTPESASRCFVLDDEDRLVATFGSEGSRTDYELDEVGRPISATTLGTPVSRIRLDLDILGRTTRARTLDVAGASETLVLTSHYRYDRLGREVARNTNGASETDVRTRYGRILALRSARSLHPRLASGQCEHSGWRCKHRRRPLAHNDQARAERQRTHRRSVSIYGLAARCWREPHRANFLQGGKPKPQQLGRVRKRARSIRRSRQTPQGRSRETSHSTLTGKTLRTTCIACSDHCWSWTGSGLQRPDYGLCKLVYSPRRARTKQLGLAVRPGFAERRWTVDAEFRPVARNGRYT